ncbi:Ribonucleotide reductase of class Ib (aerobic),alpha subunit [Klebsiella pneumoniae ISC21]|nr:Ribonucleotide reductase of class Ib (aerobic),alpha subunit [Klebsiella pneumoniae ISC21]
MAAENRTGAHAVRPRRHLSARPESWRQLRDDVMRYGIYNRYLQAVPPTGSISYINHATSSIHPIVSKIEIRKEGENRTGVLPRAIYE